MIFIDRKIANGFIRTVCDDEHRFQLRDHHRHRTVGVQHFLSRSAVISFAIISWFIELNNLDLETKSQGISDIKTKILTLQTQNFDVITTQ